MPLPPAPIDSFRRWTADRFQRTGSAVIDALGDAGWHIGAEDRINQLAPAMPEPEPFQAPPPVELPPPVPVEPPSGPGPSSGLGGAIGGAFSGLGSRTRGALRGAQEALGGANAAAVGSLNAASTGLATGLQTTAERTGVEDWASQAANQIEDIGSSIPSASGLQDFSDRQAAALEDTAGRYQAERPDEPLAPAVLKGFGGEAWQGIGRVQNKTRQGIEAMTGFGPQGADLGAQGIGAFQTGTAPFTVPGEISAELAGAAGGLPETRAAAQGVMNTVGPGGTIGSIQSGLASRAPNWLRAAPAALAPAGAAVGIGTGIAAGAPPEEVLSRGFEGANIAAGGGELAAGLLPNMPYVYGAAGRLADAARVEYGDTAGAIPVDVARGLPYDVRMPADAAEMNIINQSRGIRLTPDGVEVDTLRFQKPTQAGQPATREAIYYSPEGGGGPRYESSNPNAAEGGSEMLRQTTLLKRPLVVERTGEGYGASTPVIRKLFPGQLGESRARGLTGTVDDAVRMLARGSPDLAADRMEGLLTQFGGYEASEARRIAEDTVRFNAQNPNMAKYPLVDAVGANLARQHGYDGILYARGGHVQEYISLLENTYPTKAGGFSTRELPQGFTAGSGARNPGLDPQHVDALTVLHDEAYQAEAAGQPGAALIRQELRRVLDNPTAASEVQQGETFLRDALAETQARLSEASRQMREAEDNWRNLALPRAERDAWLQKATEADDAYRAIDTRRDLIETALRQPFAQAGGDYGLRLQDARAAAGAADNAARQAAAELDRALADARVRIRDEAELTGVRPPDLGSAIENDPDVLAARSTEQQARYAANGARDALGALERNAPGEHATTAQPTPGFGIMAMGDTVDADAIARVEQALPPAARATFRRSIDNAFSNLGSVNGASVRGSANQALNAAGLTSDSKLLYKVLQASGVDALRMPAPGPTGDAVRAISRFSEMTYEQAAREIEALGGVAERPGFGRSPEGSGVRSGLGLPTPQRGEPGFVEPNAGSSSFASLRGAASPFMARAAQTPGERAFDLGTGVASGAAGAASGPEDQTWQQRAARGALGFAGGTLAGAHARQLGRVGARALRPLAGEGGELAGDLARIVPPGTPFEGKLGDVTEGVPPVPGTAPRFMGKGPLERMPEPVVPPGAREITLTPAQEEARLRLDKFPDWARGTIKQGAEAGEWFKDQRRGVLPEAEQARLAGDAQRTTEQWIKDGRAGRTYNTEETRALANAIAGQAKTVNDLTATVNAARQSGDVTDRMLAEWYTEGQKLQALTALRSGNMAEWGRVGQALKAQAKAVDASPAEAAQRLFAKVGDRDKALEALAAYNGLVDDGASPAALANFWARIEKGEAKFGDWLSLLRYNSMLSGMPTMVVNAAGSAAELATKYPMDVASSLARGKPGEIKAETQGALAGMRAAWEPFKQIIKEGITDDAALAGGVPSSVAARTTNRAARGAATALEAPMRLQSATDEFFNRIAYGMSAGRRSAQRATEQGLSGEAWNEEVARLMNELPPEMAARAKADADRLTFRTDVDPKSIGGRIGGARKAGGWVGDLVMPFFKTVYNITARGVERSPLGLAGTFVDASLKPFGKGAYAKSWSDPTLVKAGVTPIGERVANNVLGSAISVGFASMALDGNLSGKGPDNPRDRDVLRAQGWSPYSIKVGDRWVSYSNWGPYAIPLALGAAVGEAKRYGVEGEPWSDSAAGALKQVGGLLADQPYLSGIGAIYKAVDDPERYGSQWLSQYMGSLIPYGSALSSVAAAGDPNEREAPQGGNVLETALGNVQARLPGTREQLPIRRDVFGNPIENTRQGIASQLPVRVAPEGADYTRDVRRYAGARDAAEDVRAAAAIRHVEDYINGRTIKRPNRAEQELYARFAGNENPIFTELTGQGRALEQQAKIDAERRRLGAGSLAG